MTMTYQQEFVLAGVAGRAAILNLDARHNRLYSAGDFGGWVATFRHAGATFVRAGETYTNLRDAFDGGNGRRLVTVDHEVTVDGVDATQNCVALLFVGPELRATGTFKRQARLRARRLVFHVARAALGHGAQQRCAAGMSR